MKRTLAFGTQFLVFQAIPQNESVVGKEVALQKHLRDGAEYELPVARLVQFPERLFSAKWTIQEGAGRPDVKGTGNRPQLSDLSQARWCFLATSTGLGARLQLVQRVP
jgi:hypothetical protein